MYPLYFSRSRPYANEFLAGIQSPQSDSSAAERLAMSLIFPHLQKHGYAGRSLLPLAGETQGLLIWGQWSLTGEPVLEATLALQEALLRTDLGDVSLSDVLGPEPFCWYLRVHDSPLVPKLNVSGLPLGIEGAYVYSARESVRVVLCAQASAELPVLSRWQERYDLRIPASLYELPAAEAVEQALSADKADVLAAKSKMAAVRVSPVSTEDDAEFLLKRLDSNISAYAEVVKYLVNLLAYSKTHPEDNAVSWSIKAPDRLVRQAGQGTAVEKKRAISKLRALGFIPVKMLGQMFAEQSLRESAGVKAAHWRRGHWRNQPWGPGFSLRKIIWIRPVMVGLN